MLKFTARDRLKLLGGAAAFALTGCGDKSGGTALPPVILAPPPPPPPPVTQGPAEGLLRDTLRNDFKIGAAMSSFQVANAEMSAVVAKSQFNSLTPEFQLKPNIIAPTEGTFDFTEADALVDWAIANGMDVRGHALLWHESTPDYFLEGTNAQIKARLENYITTVVEHFKGRIRVWDVVNEVVSVDLFRGTDGVGPDRRSNWYEAVGSADYVDWAFLAARAADPEALLFINDFETENAQKLAWLIEIVQRLQARGVPIDGVGHQMHLQPNTLIADALVAIDGIDNQFMGLINHVTELDLSAYQNPGSCWTSGTDCEADIGPVPPATLLAAQAQKMRDLFNGLKARPSVTSVTTWGVIDSDSWLNTLPVQRYNYPLLFDRGGNPKPAFHAITDDDYEITAA